MTTTQALIPLKNLAHKMMCIREDVQYIQKQGRNDFHKYNYVTDSDVVSVFSKAMQKHRVFMFPSIIERECLPYKTRGGKDAFLVTVKLEITFVDVDSGECFAAVFYGDGCDSDDKAIYKAITGAQKYALMKTFLVATGDDPEQDRTQEDTKEHQGKSDTKISDAEKEKLLILMYDKARQGTEVFRHTWKTLSVSQRALVKDQIGVYEQLAKQADHTLAVEDVPQ